MTLLLDTHTLLWMMLEPEKLSAKARAGLADPGNSLLIGISTLWEITIKTSLGKFRIPGQDIGYVLDHLDSFRVGVLPIRPEHLVALQALPHIHRDPFDRILIAQAQTERIPLITADKEILRYDPMLL